MIIKHKRGRHRSSPFILKLRDSITKSFRFDNSCAYDIGKDQSDWNKLTGIKRRFLFPRRDSVLIGWRWSDGKIEVVPYIHRNGHTDHDYTTVGVMPGEWFRVIVAPGFGVKIKDLWYVLPQTWERGWQVNSWFGGNRKAPHEIKIETR